MTRSTAARVSNFMQSLRGWLVRVGLASPPREASAEPLTNEQRQARRRLRFLAVPRPPRAPR
jgi:endonuclease YncB( thermonuclease family)